MRELVDILRRNYCGNVGVEYMHINDLEERRFVQERIEGREKAIEFTENGKKGYVCMPLAAQGETLGILHLCEPNAAEK